MLLRLQCFPTLDNLTELLDQNCNTDCHHVSLCDLDGAVGEVIPLAHYIRVAHLILGVGLIFAPCWRLCFARVLLFYWILYDCLEIYQPFMYGEGFNLYVSNSYLVYYTVFSTNPWLLDVPTTVAGFLFCTWLWPRYAAGDLESGDRVTPGVDVPHMLFLMAGGTLMHCLYSSMGYLSVDA